MPELFSERNKNRSYDAIDVATILYDEIIEHLPSLPHRSEFNEIAQNALEDTSDNYSYIEPTEWMDLMDDMWELFIQKDTDQHV